MGGDATACLSDYRDLHLLITSETVGALSRNLIRTPQCSILYLQRPQNARLTYTVYRVGQAIEGVWFFFTLPESAPSPTPLLFSGNRDLPQSGSRVNLLKPIGYVMHHQFNIQQIYALPTLYLCVLYLSENKQRLVPLTA